MKKHLNSARLLTALLVSLSLSLSLSVRRSGGAAGPNSLPGISPIVTYLSAECSRIGRITLRL